ncbi:MAG: Bax inhibitor-1 family protein, partial [Alphaproteobacteria bacterium]|nr:Bax inhibitor-1 family protein [Alphaproteobacteria bacterium]
MEKNYTSAVEKVEIDQGLKDYFIGVYNHMAGGLAVTALCAFVVANTSLINLMFNPQGGMSALGWLFLLAPLFIVFGFGWVVSRGTLSQVRGVFIAYSALMGVSLAPIFLVYTGA